MKKLTVLRLDHSNGYKKYLEYPIYIQENLISEIYPIAVRSNWKDSDIGDGREDAGVRSIIVMNNGSVLRVTESIEQILCIE